MYIVTTKQIYRLTPHVNIRWTRYDLFINGLKEHKLGVGMLVIDVFDKFMHVVPVKGKEEEDLASGMIERLNKMGMKPEIMSYRRRGSNEQGGNTSV